jgi:hypothetical protein
MSLNMTDKDSSSFPSSTNRLQRFPSSDERANYRDWRFRSTAFFKANNVLHVVEHPVLNMPTRADTAFRAVKNVQYIGSNEQDPAVEELNKSSDLAYNWIIQSIHDKQLISFVTFIQATHMLS